MTLPYSVSALHEDIVEEGFQDEIWVGLTNRSFMLRRLAEMGHIRQGSGAGIEFDVTTEENDSAQGGFEIGGVLNAPGAAVSKHGRIPWGNYEGSFKIADRQIKESLSAGERARYYARSAKQAESLKRRLVDKISTDCITGSTSSDTAGTIIGTCGGQIEDDNSFGGLSRSTYPALACTVHENGGTPRAVTDVLIRALIDEHEQVVEGNPLTVGFCGYALWNSISALSGVTETKNDASPLAAVAKMLGISVLYYDGKPIIKVPGYTAGRLDFVHEPALWLEYLPAINPIDGQPMSLEEDGGAAIFDLKEPEVDGDSYISKVFAYLALVVEDPRMNACSLQDIST